MADVKLEWTSDDKISAHARGWDLFESERYTGTGPDGVHNYVPELQLQKLDERDVFDDDAKAWAHVRARAAEGCPLSSKALAILQRESPAEYTRIVTVTI